MRDGTIAHDRGLGMLRRHGVVAERNITVDPSLTARGAHRDRDGIDRCEERHRRQHIPSGGEPVQVSTISGFGCADRRLLDSRAGRARCADRGAAVARAPRRREAQCRRHRNLSRRRRRRRRGAGTAAGSPMVQPSAERTVELHGPVRCVSAGRPAARAHGSSMRPRFGPAPADDPRRARQGGESLVQPRVADSSTPIETFTVPAGADVHHSRCRARYDERRQTVNYDTLVFFDATLGIQPGPFALPATGPAYVKASEARIGAVLSRRQQQQGRARRTS